MVDLPVEIGLLKQLREMKISRGRFKREQKAHIKSLLPKCKFTY